MFIGTASPVYSFLARRSIMTLPSLKSRNIKKDNMKVDDEKEKLYYDTYQPEELEEIINTQRKIIHYMKEQKMKKLHSILIIVDDFCRRP